MNKKLFAFMVSDIGWKALLAFMIYQWDSPFTGQSLMMTVVVVSGIVQLAFLLGGQAEPGPEPKRKPAKTKAKPKPQAKAQPATQVPQEVSK